MELDDCLTFKQVDDRCEVIRCPAIARPINGRFDGDVCDNRYRSNCHALCDDGYDLIGSASFECTLDGSWQTNENAAMEEPFCQSKTLNKCFLWDIFAQYFYVNNLKKLF